MKRRRPASSLADLKVELAARVGELERHRIALVWLARLAPLRTSRQALLRTIAALDGRLDLWRSLLRDLRQEQRRWAEGASAGELASIKHVPDGDGLELADGRRARYLGIDAPEVGGKSSPSAPWAEEAKAFNQRLVEGREVLLVRDVSNVDVHG